MMTFALSTNYVIKTIYALGALDRRDAAAERPLPELLNPDRREAVATLVKNEFALLCASLFPLVSNCCIDEGNPADELLQMDVNTAMTPAGDSAGAIRRALEQLLALRSLIAVMLYSGEPVAAMQQRAEVMLADIRMRLAPAMSPMCATPWRV